MMTGTYKHSYKMGEPRLNALSVYNVGYQKCEPEYQWGPGIRDHYCIHHIILREERPGIYKKGIRSFCIQEKRCVIMQIKQNHGNMHGWGSWGQKRER